MASAPVASIIRQPHGPSGSTGFGAPVVQMQGGGVTAQEGQESSSGLRRASTFTAPRHGVSASISSTPAGSSAFHGSRGQDGSGRFRSGSLSSSNNADPGLVRKVSSRGAVRAEGVLPESSNEESSSSSGYWSKGLSRQSSLPPRRGVNLSATSALEPLPPRASNQPLRQQGRLRVDRDSGTTTPVPPSTAYSPSHTSSQSLSSLSMFNQSAASVQLYDNTNFDSSGANVSRTHSLHAQAKQPDLSALGRSTSMKAAGEQYYRPPSARSSVVTPPALGNSIDLASPPPNSSTAAFPPYRLPASEFHRDSSSQGADVRRHQSLNFGPSSRLRGRNDGASSNHGLLQRERSLRLGEGHAPRISQDIAPAPTSPIGPSLWSPSHSGADDGWDRGTTQQIQDAFNAMNLGGISSEDPEARRSAMLGDLLRPQVGHLGEEPSWVANLVGGADRPPTLAARSGWKDEQAGYPVDSWSDPYASLGAYTRQAPLTGVNPRLGPVPGQPGQYLGQSGPYGTPIAQYGGPTGPYQIPYPGFIPQAYSPAFNGSTTPHSAPLADEDSNVVELSKAKGLNPSTYNCRPEKARFFVIKSYTEEDVQKSLKHEIWSSTVLGNKRLDAAFRESSDEMPIYLFFSVNGSRHFCGVAKMLTRVDETKSSDVWSENNKWKGIFKVKWIFVRDVPSAALRHIRLLNTPEQKPITNSRDTQELHYEAGCEVLQIFLDYQSKSKTSLLQDYAHYERLSSSRPTSRPSSAASHKSRNGGQSDYPQPAPPGRGSFMVAPPVSYSIPPGALEPGVGIVPPVPPIPARYL